MTERELLQLALDAWDYQRNNQENMNFIFEDIRSSLAKPEQQLTDGLINEITMDSLGKWPSFEAQSWACKVVHAVLTNTQPTIDASMKDVTDLELLLMAARAAGLRVVDSDTSGLRISSDGCCTGYCWNPFTDDGDRYRLSQKLGISINYEDCRAWTRQNGKLIQEFWGRDCPNEAHAIVSVAAAVGVAK
jgi:hypothetical protein